MNSLAISGIIFACVCGGALLGMVLRAVLPAQHLGSEAKDVVKLGMGLLGTMTAMVLGLMIASAKSTFDTQRTGLAQLAGNVIMLDRILEHYGPESKDAREMLRASVADMIARTWAAESSAAGQTGSGRTEGRYEGLFEKVEALAPKNDAQRAWQAQALKLCTDMAQMRLGVVRPEGEFHPHALPVSDGCLAGLIVRQFQPLCASQSNRDCHFVGFMLAVSSAIFLILELDRPFAGVIQISSEPLRAALTILGH